MRWSLCFIILCGLLFSCRTDNEGIFNNLTVKPDDNLSSEVELISYEMNGQQVFFERIDGQLIFQGDIVIDEELLNPQVKGAGILPWSSKKWIDNKVYYVIDPSIPSTNAIKEAIKDWQLNSNLIFFPRTTQSNYIKFVRSSTVNNSYVGMQGGGQVINLYNYNLTGTVAHEIGHAIGLWHEHSRADRDFHIIINWNNIKENKRFNFAIYDSGMDYGPFDFNSIMLYDSYIRDTASVFDTSIPVMTKLDGTTFTDQNVISDGDRYAIQTLYTPIKIYGDASWKPCPADYDGDWKIDLNVKTNDGYWLIDYAKNGFGKWDDVYSEYGGSSSIPVPADYDGDGKADFSVKDGSGKWFIDYAKNGFGVWDITYSNYGGSTSIPVPADYDGDGKADLSVKDDSGKWFIDYSNNGFGAWDRTYSGYGGSYSIPIPADYDGDGKADLSVKDNSGKWFIDYSNNSFGAWDRTYSGYGDSYSIPVPADYDGDGKADLSVKDRDGKWFIDYSNNGFGSWNVTYTAYGDSKSIPVPADYDGDGNADLSVKDGDGHWFIDYANNGFGSWNWRSSN